MWDLPGPGLEPMFPALAGGFLTTAPPGKPSLQDLGGLRLVLREDTLMVGLGLGFVVTLQFSVLLQRRL